MGRGFALTIKCAFLYGHNAKGISQLALEQPLEKGYYENAHPQFHTL